MARAHKPHSPRPLKTIFPAGATTTADGVYFRVWAPRLNQIDVVFNHLREPFALNKEGGGYFGGMVKSVLDRTLYRYRINGRQMYPDPCSRIQREGPHGASMVVDPEAYVWKDRD